MPCTFPLYVKLHNARLQVLHTFLYALTGLVMVIEFVVLASYTQSIPLIGKVFLNTASSAGNMDQLGLRPGMNLWSCGHPEYWQQTHAAFQYGNFSCITTCEFDQYWENTSAACFSLPNTVFTEGVDTLLVATHLKTPGINGHRDYFVSSAEATPIGITFSVGRPYTSMWSPSQHNRQIQWQSSISTLVVVLESKNKIWRTFAPGSDIHMSLADVLRLAGVTSLDQINAHAGFNKAPGSAASGPSLRLSGVTLEIDIDCGDGNPGYRLQPSDGVTACAIMLTYIPSPWVTFFKGHGNQTAWGHGVRLTAAMKGSHIYVDLGKCFVYFASMMVYFSLPRYLVFCIAMHLCGEVSQVYKNIVYRRVDLTTEAGAAALRLLEHDLHFTELEAHDADDKGLGYITKQSVSRRLAHIFQKRGIVHKVELQRIVDFCVSTVCTRFVQSKKHTMLQDLTDSASTIFADLRSACFGLKAQVDHTVRTIDIDQFAGATSDQEMIPFACLSSLLDQSRKISPLEAIFMPLEFKAYLEEFRAACDVKDTKLEEEETQVVPNRRRTSHRLGCQVDKNTTAIESVINRVNALEHWHGESFDGEMTSLREQIKAIQEEVQQLAAQMAQLRVVEQIHPQNGKAENVVKLQSDMCEPDQHLQLMPTKSMEDMLEDLMGKMQVSMSEVMHTMYLYDKRLQQVAVDVLALKVHVASSLVGSVPDTIRSKERHHQSQHTGSIRAEQPPDLAAPFEANIDVLEQIRKDVISLQSSLDSIVSTQCAGRLVRTASSTEAV